MRESVRCKTDPNNSSTATPKLVLPSAQSQLELPSAMLGIGTGMWAQYWTGADMCIYYAGEYYNMVGTDVDGSWTDLRLVL